MRQTYHHARWLQLDSVAIAIQIFKLRIVAGDDATFPRAGVLCKYSRD